MNPSRRRYLTIGGTALAATLAGCSSTSDGDSASQDGTDAGSSAEGSGSTASTAPVAVEELRVPTAVDVGEAYTATLSLRNEGEQAEPYSGTVDVTGPCISDATDVDATIEAGETAAVEVDVPAPECEGEVRVALSDADFARTVTVEPYPTPRSAVHDHRYSETNAGVTEDPGPSSLPEAVQAYENAISPTVRISEHAIAMVGSTTSNGRGSVRVLDPDGTERWTKQLQFPNTEPALFEQRLYVVDANDLRCYDVDTGEVLWEFTEAGPPSEEVAYSEMYGTPLVSGGTVYFNGMHGQVWAVNAYSGRKQWSASLTPDDENVPISGIPATDGETLYVVGDDGYRRSERGPLVALDAETGEVRWETDDEFVVGGTTPVRGDLVYVRTLERDGLSPTETIRAYDTDAGSMEWETELDDLNTDPVVDDEHVYLGRSWPSSNASGELVALDRSTGTVAWRTERDAGIVNAPTVGANGLFVTDWEDALMSVAPQSGEVKWETADLAYRVTPTIDGDRLYMVERDTNVVTAFA